MSPLIETRQALRLVLLSVLVLGVTKLSSATPGLVETDLDSDHTAVLAISPSSCADGIAIENADDDDDQNSRLEISRWAVVSGYLLCGNRIRVICSEDVLDRAPKNSPPRLRDLISS